jgi:hypothetical protein
MITSIATLVNEFAIDDVKVLLFTLALWNEEAPTVYIFSDEASAPLLRAIPYRGKVIIKEDALNSYTGLNRRAMENRRDATGKTLFQSFTEEKTSLMEWALSLAGGEGVLFCDADICHLGPLPEIPSGTELALSPHLIRKADTDRYGIYNAGYLWFQSPAVAARWREACTTSRFFEQACLETLATEFTLYEFPVQVNYGWWRLWQGSKHASILQSEWGLHRQGETCSGLTVHDEAVQSIHTHWGERVDQATYQFNMWILAKLRKLTSVKKTASLVKFLVSTFGLIE